MSEVNRALQAVIDKLDIAEHTAFYNRCWDDNEPEAWVNTWTPDGKFVMKGVPPTVGAEALSVMIRAMAVAGLVHLTMNHSIEIDGDTARQTCAVVLARRDSSRAPGTSEWLTAGRYNDELTRTSDGWRFARSERSLPMPA